jgi:hypothetical protein
MLEAVPLLAVTLGFLSVFLYNFATLQLEDIKKNWNQRRCEPLVMTMAHLAAKEGDDPQQFSIDNFQFCIGKLIDSSLMMVIGPMLKVFSQQVDSTKPIQESINSLRGSAGSLLTPVNALFGKVWEKFGFVLYQVVRVFIKLMSAFDRVFGIATASLFAGMSMIKALENSMNFVINVCIIILTILVVLVIFLWFIMWPVVPVILTLIGVLSATVHAGKVGGMAGSFCVTGETLVRTEKGWREVREIHPGDRLGDGSFVEGVLETVGAPVVNYKGILISPSHLVWHTERNAWIPAGELEGAKPVEEIPEKLYCLNVDSHVWEVRALGGTILKLRDWEELPDGFDAIWESLIAKLLDTTIDVSSPGRGLIGGQTKVYVEGGGLLAVSKVRLGDLVKDRGDKFTRVLAVYRDCSELLPAAGQNAAAWVRQGSLAWQHRVSGKYTSNDGWHLITESGTFLIEGGVCIRDFTEIGIDRIHETYEFVTNLLAYNIRNDAPHNLSNQRPFTANSSQCSDDKLCVSGLLSAR